MFIDCETSWVWPKVALANDRGGQMGANEPIVAPSGFLVALDSSLTTYYRLIIRSIRGGSSCQRMQRVCMGHALLSTQATWLNCLVLVAWLASFPDFVNFWSTLKYIEGVFLHLTMSQKMLATCDWEGVGGPIGRVGVGFVHDVYGY